MPVFNLRSAAASAIDWLVGISLDAVACKSDLSYIEHARLDNKRLKACLSDLERLPPMPGLADKIDFFERMMLIDTVTMIQRKEPKRFRDRRTSTATTQRATLSWLKAGLLANACNWDLILRDTNRWFDRLGTATRLKDRTERNAELKKIDTEMEQLFREPKKTMWETLQAALAQMLAAKSSAISWWAF